MLFLFPQHYTTDAARINKHICIRMRMACVQKKNYIEGKMGTITSRINFFFKHSIALGQLPILIRKLKRIISAANICAVGNLDRRLD